ncbi:Transport protein [Dehalogenimonas formicexedens]|uniref:Transport protein n=1 Tax=Dehalogenimonas formicexedens TaxID=1839801 RepID=A0A1P8F7U5_9CHLR|nr:MMPL family transporter [Dehalogenimonas formicexedens]APV44515.1 Transport protein [Dehalogenimonas formicexedens]
MFKTIASISRRYKWLIAVVWTGAAIASFLFAPKLSDVGINDDSQFLPSDTESTLARDIIKNRFYTAPDAPASSLEIVIENTLGLSEADNVFARALRDWLLSDSGPDNIKTVTSVFDNPALEPVLISADNTVMLINVGLGQPSLVPSSQAAVDTIRNYISGNPHPGNVYVTGQVAISKDLFQSINSTIDRTTLVTIVLVAVLLLIAYRSPVASMVPLIAIGWSFLIARGLVGFMAESGLKVSTLADAYLVVIIFGIGTDYCLFIISRLREELAARRHDAVGYTMAKIGPVISASALTVIIAFLCLWVSQFGMTKSVGVALATGVAITLLAGITLVPALMVIFGSKLFWPGEAARVAGKNIGWSRISAFVVSKPWLIILPVIVVLAVPYVFLPSLKRSADVIAQMPAEVEAAAGFQVIQSHFSKGELQPLYLLVSSTGSDFTDIAPRQDVDELAAYVSTLPGVMRVEYFNAPSTALSALAEQIQAVADNIATGRFDSSMTVPLEQAGEMLGSLPLRYPGIISSPAFQQAATAAQTAAQLLATIQKAPQTELPPLLSQLVPAADGLSAGLGQMIQEFNLEVSTPFTAWLYQTFFSTDKTYSRINIILDLDPYSDEAVALIPGFREDIAVKEAQLATINKTYVGGETARYADTISVTTADFGRVAIPSVAAIFVILVIVLRSLVAPLYMVATVLFNFGATLGFTTFFVQNISREPIIYVLPLFIFIMLVAVGADYNLFLMSRIREEASSVPNKQAVAAAVSHTGGVISTCGIILAGTFSVLILSPLQMVHQIGMAIALGIILDTFIVRALLVPAVARVLGRFNWWPGGGNLTRQ